MHLIHCAEDMEVVLTGITDHTKSPGFTGYAVYRSKPLGTVVRTWRAWPTASGYHTEVDGITQYQSIAQVHLQNAEEWDLGKTLANVIRR